MTFDIEYAFKCFSPILAKLPVTLRMTLIAVIIALAGGIILALGVKCKNAIVRIIVNIINSFLKGVPILVFLYIFNYSMDDIMTGLSKIFAFEYDIRNPPKVFFAILALALSYAPYMCDMIVTAYDTLPKGQMEACDAFGFTKFQAMKRIILPQMLVVALPNFGNHFVNLLKATSLAYMVTILEMLGAAKNFAVLNQRFLETYVVAALIYWVVFGMFEQIFQFLERNSGKYLRLHIVQKRRLFKEKAV